MILQTTLPHDPFIAKRLPGIAPLDMAEWLHVDEAYAAQMAERARLLNTCRDKVFWQSPVALEPAKELLDLVLEHLPNGFRNRGTTVQTPDGREVALDGADPLLTCAALVQEDLCLMIKSKEEHNLQAAVLCFPASWQLAEKAGRPLVAIHDRIRDYDRDVARRVQRLFDGVQPGRPLWRFNALWYEDPTLFQPRSATEPRAPTDPGEAPYFRSERQCILRLPRTRAVVFSIHTYVLRRDDALALGAGESAKR